MGAKRDIPLLDWKLTESELANLFHGWYTETMKMYITQEIDWRICEPQKGLHTGPEGQAMACLI